MVKAPLGKQGKHGRSWARCLVTYRYNAGHIDPIQSKLAGFLLMERMRPTRPFSN